METKNFMIRETVFEDCEYFAKCEVEPGVTQFLSFDEGRTYKEVVEEWFRDKMDSNKIQLTIVMKSEDKPIGRMIITRIDHANDSLDITKLYIGEKENRNKGYGREVLLEILEHCFVFLHMERVTIDHYIGNKSAAALYQSIGFENEGIARHACKKNGMYYDVCLMSMLRSEFFEKVHDK